jgi:hypothetical protein
MSEREKSRRYKHARTWASWARAPFSFVDSYPIGCPFCPHRFRNMGGLTRHLQSHNICRWCGTRAKNLHGLHIHQARFCRIRMRANSMISGAPSIGGSNG